MENLCEDFIPSHVQLINFTLSLNLIHYMLPDDTVIFYILLKLGHMVTFLIPYPQSHHFQITSALVIFIGEDL